MTMRIKEAGVYAMDAKRYHADPVETPSLSNGIARLLIRRSPMHAWHAHPRLNPTYQEAQREDFDYGSACHALLLEGENRIAVIPYDDYRKGAAQELRDIAREEGKFPILEKKFERVVRMREVALRAIAACPHFKGMGLHQAKIEETVIWREGKAFCRARPDAYWPELNTGFDYKTTTDATPEVFTRQIARMAYDFQDGFYRRGLDAVFGEGQQYLFMAQENEEPFACSFHGCAPSMREIAERRVGHAIRGWAWCQENNSWPSYDPRIHWAEAPSWELSQHMDQVELEQNGNPFDPAELYGSIMRELAA